MFTRGEVVYADSSGEAASRESVAIFTGEVLPQYAGDNKRYQAQSTRDQLLDLARGRAATAFDRSIDLHASRLRYRIEVDPKEPELIKTVRTGGYVFSAPVTLNGEAW